MYACTPSLPHTYYIDMRAISDTFCPHWYFTLLPNIILELMWVMLKLNRGHGIKCWICLEIHSRVSPMCTHTYSMDHASAAPNAEPQMATRCQLKLKLWVHGCALRFMPRCIAFHFWLKRYRILFKCFYTVLTETQTRKAIKKKNVVTSAKGGGYVTVCPSVCPLPK